MHGDQEDGQADDLLPNAVGLVQVDRNQEDRGQDVHKVALVQNVGGEGHKAQQVGNDGVKVQHVEQEGLEAVDDVQVEVPELGKGEVQQLRRGRHTRITKSRM